jgi:membrane protease YdiL (CAAX protease family)
MSVRAPDHRRLITLAVLFEGGLAVLALGLGWLVDEPPLRSLHWSWNGAFASVAATVPMLLMLVICLRWPVGPLARVRALLDDFVRPIFSGCSAMEVTAIAGLAGLGEEMLFRGVLQGLSSRWFGPWMGIGLVNVLFGLLHMVTPTYALTAGLTGLYLGWLMLWKQNLLVVIVPHALFDLAALLYVIYSPASQIDPPAQDQRCS